MRLPHVRYTVRRMMVVVLIVAIMLATHVTLQRRRVRFERLSHYHIQSIRIESFCSCAPSEPEESDVLSDKALRQALWHLKLSRKYGEAARRPWLPVSPDPPEPE